MSVEPTPSEVPWDPNAPITLTVWVPVDLAVEAEVEDTAASALHAALADEEPPVNVVMAPKGTDGPGSLINLLLAMQPIAPSRMPDIIAVDSTDLERLAAEGVLVPLDALIPEDVWEDLFPFASEAGSVAGARVGVPFQADITFLAYNSTMIEEPPATWSELLALGAQYLIPAGDGDMSGADAFAAQYVALGGAFEVDGRPHLDRTLTEQVLRAFEQAAGAGVIPENARSVGTLEESWRVYLTGQVAMSDVSAHLYQSDADKLQRTHYAPLPTIYGHPATLARTWSWAIVTPDARRQAVAARYLVESLQSERMSASCTTRYQLPTRRSALAMGVVDEDLGSFLEGQLEIAKPYPRVEGWSQVKAVLLRAVQDTLDGRVSSEQAAETAVAEVARLR
ncbi:MAG: extracellular solute-binding protein [Anaerolineae bacterium]